MPRRRIHRQITYRPRARYYKPRGIPLTQLEEVVLRPDELEAIRLKYVEGLEQIAAAARMHVSQSTFQRILTSANQKVGQALVTGKAILIDEQP